VQENLKTFISSDEKQLLWTLVQYDTVVTVLGLLNSESSTVEKVSKIIAQMDFIFEIRVALQQMPPQGGKIVLTELGRAYLSTLLDHVRQENLSPELRATFLRDRDSLQLKFGDAVKGFLVPAPGEVKGS
jgi:hypothetical protein